MRKLLFLLLLIPAISFAQGTATNIRNGSSLPTACANGDIFYKTSGSIGVYECTSPGNPGTWTHVPYTVSNLVALFSGCSGTQYLGADGACHTAVGSPAGSDTQIQFNDGGAFGGDSQFIYDKSTHTFKLGTGSSAQGYIKLFDTGGTNYAGIKAPSSVSGSYTWILPAADASGCVKSDGAGTISVSSCGSGTVSTTGSPASGNLAKFSGSTSLTNGDLSGDATTSGTLVVTVPKVNGVAYPSSPSTHSVPVITASNTATYKVVPDCTDTTGNHLNYTQSTDAFSCGTSSSGGGGTASVDDPPGSPNAKDDEFSSSFNAGSLWTWVNQSTATATTSNGSLLLYHASASGDNTSIIVQNVPATPWTITAKCTFVGPPTNVVFGGLAVRDSGTGKLVLYGPGENSGRMMQVYNFTNPTASSAQVIETLNAAFWSWTYWRIKDDGTNMIFSFSFDGISYYPAKTVTRTSFLANPNQFGLFIYAGAGTAADGHLDATISCSYFRVS